MNEIELLHRHIEEVAVPSSEFVGRTRGRLLEVIEASNDGGGESATRTAVQVGAAPAAPKARRRSFRVLLGAAVGVAALVIALVVTLVVVPTGTPGGPAKSAAAELRLFASQAGNVPALARGQYFYSALEIPVTDVWCPHHPDLHHQRVPEHDLAGLGQHGWERTCCATPLTPPCTSSATPTGLPGWRRGHPPPRFLRFPPRRHWLFRRTRLISQPVRPASWMPATCRLTPPPSKRSLRRADSADI